MTQPSPPVDLRGTVWSRTTKDILGTPHTTYVLVTDHGPTHAHVQSCDAQGRVWHTLGNGGLTATSRRVQLSHEGTRVKGRKQVTA
jgi:hypothetical protein